MTDLKPCRFCGETERLVVDYGAWPTTWALDADGEIMRDPSGQPTEDVEPYRELHNIDQVVCQTCETMTSVRVWNSTPEWMARAAGIMKAADAEYDDDGEWQGPSLKVAD